MYVSWGARVTRLTNAEAKEVKRLIIQGIYNNNMEPRWIVEIEEVQKFKELIIEEDKEAKNSEPHNRACAASNFDLSDPKGTCSTCACNEYVLARPRARPHTCRGASVGSRGCKTARPFTYHSEARNSDLFDTIFRIRPIYQPESLNSNWNVEFGRFSNHLIIEMTGS